MHIIASSDLPVPLASSAELNIGEIMALHARLEWDRSKFAMCFPSTIQALLCRLDYVLSAFAVSGSEMDQRGGGVGNQVVQCSN